MLARMWWLTSPPLLFLLLLLGAEQPQLILFYVQISTSMLLRMWWLTSPPLLLLLLLLLLGTEQASANSMFCSQISKSTSMLARMWWLTSPPLLLLLLLLGVEQPQLASGRQVEVEDVTARQLEAAIQTEDIVAVYWCKYTVDIL
jgi:hypothetical protein